MPTKKLIKKILIIEDEKPLSRALDLKLTHEGFQAVIAINGEEAIAVLKKEEFAMIICDLIMPKIDGFQVLEFIKNNKIKTPVIVLTNLGQEEDEKRVKDLVNGEFFIKSNTSIVKIVEHIKEKIG